MVALDELAIEYMDAAEERVSARLLVLLFPRERLFTRE
jgi:hypothetical protein